MTARRTLFSRGLLAALTLVALGASAKADEIYSNFGPGNSFNTLSGWGVLGPTGSSTFPASLVGSKFTVSQNVTLTGFDIGGYYRSGVNSFLFSIVRDNGGLPTGTSVFSTSSALTGTPTAPQVNSFAATGSLLAGNTYWLVVQPGASNSFGVWNFNNTGASGAVYFEANTWTQGNESSPTFRISGTPQAPSNLTPEVPAGVQAVPVLLAVAGMALYQRKKKHA